MKKIEEFKGKYLISKDGKVYNAKTMRELRGGNNGKGYIQVALQKEKKQVVRKIHRLVALTYIPNPLNKPQVNHIDGNKGNNKVENLEWVTQEENTKHSYKLGLQKPLYGKNNPMYGMNGKNNAKSKKVMCKKYNETREFESLELAVKWLKINGYPKANSSSISLCCRGIRYKKTYGYEWRYING